ncbi:DHH family phosphoesterase [Microscilla marina]|uniref:Fjo19 n=1 Tax=Microscilla marina ATCC 23134 TaxID=313606 RepID=A1ZPM4_MICM2|nr:bifunctional oligoribonuclease/PAP phosphatase NrnA [Microscilla marina]EAY27763.1 Fjo19 [Microscilla marina ATCC 23134]
MQHIEGFKEMMSTPQTITIIAHHNPDADSLGSSLALASYLKKKNHQVQVISPSNYPVFLDWMTNSDDVIIYWSKTHNLCQRLIQQADVVFCIDFSSYNRSHDLQPFIKETSGKVAIIDHHLEPNIKADYQLWNVKAAATAELIYDFIVMMGDKHLIDVRMGEYLYAGLVTDTSSFKHPSTTKKSHLITAELMDLGVETNRIQRLIYDNNSESKLKFLGYALREKLTVLRDFRTAYFTISVEEQERFNHQPGDTEGLVNYALSITGILFAVIIIEKPDVVKLSFRSVGEFAANEFARKHFSGGGHQNAAGGVSSLSMEEVQEKFLGLLPAYKDQLMQQKIW